MRLKLTILYCFLFLFVLLAGYFLFFSLPEPSPEVEEEPLEYQRAREEILLEEEEANILVLSDENGNDVEFEYLDTIEYQDKEYIVLIPNDEESSEIVILEVQPVDEELENYIAVENEEILEAVYAIFKDRYQDVLEFAD